MKNERGLTLIEVLATLTISTVLLGVVLLLLSSTSLQSKTSGEKYNVDAEIRKTMDTIAKEISDSNQAYAATNDFRYVTYASGSRQVKSLYYDAAAKTLKMYVFKSANIQDNVTLATPGIYEYQRDLSSHVTGVQYLPIVGTSPLSGNLSGGSAFRIVLTFTFQRSKLFGGFEDYQVKRETGFKLLQY
ncbi:prepilin-type N-terminal cleavage/methylation domain-containing protein [Paenibacillus sp. LjRoot153]|uniref:prepilin-type N-terminal cleavage/methylation domain-containing protein n=1 Tax=Paenibacillus sp. LjRoot153 TaxID=3342270 RepID=UPI003ED0C150